MNVALQIDDRIGSKELSPYFREYLDIPIEDTRLDYGDVLFESPYGPEGPCKVGFERKRLAECIELMKHGDASRFAGDQLIKMRQNCRFVFLVCEGRYRRDLESGLITTFRRTKGRREKDWHPGTYDGQHVDWRAVDGWLNTMRLLAGVHILKTDSPGNTVLEIATIHHWFTHKPWEQHSSHLKFPDSGHGEIPLDARPSFTRCVAKELPNVGWNRAATIEKVFNSVEGMLEASVEQWTMIDGITSERAHKIWWLLRGFEK